MLKWGASHDKFCQFYEKVIKLCFVPLTSVYYYTWYTWTCYLYEYYYKGRLVLLYSMFGRAPYKKVTLMYKQIETKIIKIPTALLP